MNNSTTNSNSLLSDLNAKKANFEIKASDDKKEKYAAGLQAVIDQGVVDNAIQLGDKAPDFSLSNAAGESVSLYEELKKGPVVLMWYRGGWCPYCNITLSHMQAALPDFKAQGANLLALTPELPDSSISTAEKNELEFEVLSDVDNGIANNYHVVFTLTDDVRALYENGFGLSAYNGSDDGRLPLAATYVIGQDHMVKYAFLDADYRNRAEPSEILEVLKGLK
ncbi:AhpC/TSA family protein [Putridiphycobacter roseus]|uniref:thioredoxin-dependent peroxiredoxin n=2 Tax=Putridiphycobacter roseus TaxID=2219161 RepID=A0A2W1NJV1_9FLAO|nr:AhpC/TSA family protein [Putridiphycobacter roseus]